MTDPPAFAEPWEARAFAMVRTLRDAGVVSPAEWTDALGAQIAGDGAGEVHYRHWLAALEQVVTAKGLVSDDTLQRHRTAWAHAADRTPHGEPITLRPDDFPE
jgi:nitrile hydratase accessory protein